MSLLTTLTGAVNSGLKAAKDGRTNDFQLANMNKTLADENSFAALDRAEMVSQEYMTKINQQWKKYGDGVADGSIQPDVEYEKKYQEGTDLLQANGFLTPVNVFNLVGLEGAIDFTNRTVGPDILGPGKRIDETNSRIVDTDLGPAIDMQVRTTKIGEDGGVTAYSSNLTEGGQSVADLDKQGGADAVNASTLPPLTLEAFDKAYFTALDPEFKNKVADLYTNAKGTSTIRRLGLTGAPDKEELPSERKAVETLIRKEIAAIGPEYAANEAEFESKLGGYQTTANYTNTAQTSLAMAQQAAADDTGTDMSAPASLKKVITNENGEKVEVDFYEEEADLLKADGTTTTDTTEVPALTPGTGFRADPKDPNSRLLMGPELKAAIFKPWAKDNVRMNKYSDPKTIPGNITLKQWGSVDTATRDKAMEIRRETNTKLKNNLWGNRKDDSGEAVISPRAKLTQEYIRYKGLNLTPTDRRGQSIEQFESTIKDVEGFYANMGSVANKEKFLTYLQQNPDEKKAWQDSPFDYARDNMNNTNKFLGKPVSATVTSAVNTKDVDDAVKKVNNATAEAGSVTATNLFNSIKNSVPGFVDAETVQALRDTADNLKKLTAEKENELVKFLEEGGDMRRIRAEGRLALIAAISSTFSKGDPRSGYMFNAFAQAAPLLAETGMYSTAGEDLKLNIEKGERANAQLDINLQNLGLNLEKNDLQRKIFNQNTNQDLITNNQWERNHLLQVQKHEDGQRDLINTPKINPFANQGHSDSKETAYYDLIIAPNSDTNSALTSIQKVNMAGPYFSALSTAMESLPSTTWGDNEKSSYNLLKKDFDLGANVLIQDLYQNNKSAWTKFVEAIPFVDNSAVPKAVMETVFSMAALDKKGNFTTDPNKVDEYVPVDSATGRQNYPEGISATQARSIFGSILGQGYFNSIALANSKRALHSKKD